METPNSSMRRVTRSQSAAKNIPISKLIEDSEKILTKSRKGKNEKEQPKNQEGNKASAALLDITNNSPIIGIARGGSLQTPSSFAAKNKSYSQKVMTPGSGEALLRGQVKTLLQKVEEEGEFKKLSLETRPIFPYLQGFAGTPIGPSLAPTPANTPLVLCSSEEGESGKDGLNSVTNAPKPDLELISQAFDGKVQESIESEKNLISRSLLLDFSDKSEISDASDCSSVLTQAEGEGEYQNKGGKSFTDEDNSSVWSIQANASTPEEGFEEETEADSNSYNDGGDEEEYENDEAVDELCSGINKMSIMAAKFEGKHTRFVYNSDDEIVEEEKDSSGSSCSPSIVKLNGLPTPKGKHKRFPLMEEDKE